MNTLYYSGKFTEVIKISTNLIKKYPDNKDVFLKIASAYQNLNKTQEAEKYIKKAYLLDTADAKIINAYAKICEINQKTESAFSLYKKALKIDSLDFTILNNLAKLCLNTKKYPEALKIYEILSKQDSLNSYYYRKAGFCLIKMKKKDYAIPYYYKAYEKDNKNPVNIKALANIYLKNGIFDKAIEICDKGIETDSANSDFYKIKANTYFAKNHFFRAIPVYKKVIQLGDSSYNVAKRLGISLCEIKKFSEALPYNLAVYDADTSSYSNTTYLCRTYLGLNQYDKSIEFAEKTIKLIRFAKRIEYDMYDNMATAFAEKKDYKKALEMYKKQLNVFEIKQGYFNLHNTFQTALMYEKLDDKKNALKYFQKVVDFYEKRNSKDYDNPYLKYSKQRVTKLKEDLFFKGK